MDLQDVNETLEDAVARSQIKLFGSSSRPLAVDPDPSRLHMSDSDGFSESEEGSEDEEEVLEGSDFDGDEDDFESGSESEVAYFRHDML